MAPYVIIGLGNPVLSDDAVGLLAVARARERLVPADAPDVRFAESTAGGFDLLLDLVGARRALLVDAIVTGAHPPGTCVTLALADLGPAGGDRLIGSHAGGLPTLVEAGRRCGYAMPEEVAILAVEADDVSTFSERPTAAVEDAIDGVVERISDTLDSWRVQDAPPPRG